MKEINLRTLFPEYELDCFVEVPDGDVEAFTASMTKEMADIYFEAEREASASRRRMYRYKAHYSLDAGDGIEYDILHNPLPPHEVFERTESREELYAVLCGLPEKQRDRIYKHFFLGMNKADIARLEGVNESKIRKAIERGIDKMKKIQKNFSE